MSTCQGQHPGGWDCENPAPEGQKCCYIHRRPDLSARLTREDVLAKHKQRRVPWSLDPSHESLIHVDITFAVPNDHGTFGRTTGGERITASC